MVVLVVVVRTNQKRGADAEACSAEHSNDDPVWRRKRGEEVLRCFWVRPSAA